MESHQRRGFVLPARSLPVLIVCLLACLMALPVSAGASFDVNGSSVSVADDEDTVTSLAVTAPGIVTNVRVELNGVLHNSVDDLDIMLRSPSGRAVTLMSDVCGPGTVFNHNYVIDDSFANPFTTMLASCAPGEHSPTNLEVGDSYAGFIGVQPRTRLSWFNGENPTGVWRLFVTDEESNSDGGTITSWRVEISTDNESATRVPSTGLGGGTSLVQLVKSVAGARVITDVDLRLNDLSHRIPGDLDLILQSPAGTAVRVVSDVCMSMVWPGVTLWIDDEAPTPFPLTSDYDCVDSSHFKPTDGAPGDPPVSGMPAPLANAGLSAFDGQLPAGDWKLFLYDDFASEIGYIGGFDLAITMAGAKSVTPGSPKLKYKKSRRSRIAVSGRADVSGPTLSPLECTGSGKIQFQTRSVHKRGRKKVTRYKTVSTSSAPLGIAAGKCGLSISAKLPKRYSGKSLRVVQGFLGTEFVAPFTRQSTIKVKRLRF